MRVLRFLLFGLAIGAGAVLAWRLLPGGRPAPPDPAALVERVREVARLETLEVSLHKKVRYAPDPAPAGSLWGDVAGWARHALSPPQGRAIVFADAHLSLDLSRLSAGSLRVRGRQAEVALPPLRVTVEVKPGETEVIGSNLDSAETARLLELARQAFQREVEADPALRERALASARRAISALLLGLGFEEVRFLDAPPGPA